MARGSAALALAGALAGALSGCAAPGAAPALSESDRGERVAELVRAIRAQQMRTLRAVTDPEPHSPLDFREDPELRAAAHELPVLQQEIRALEGERALIDEPAAWP